MNSESESARYYRNFVHQNAINVIYEAGVMFAAENHRFESRVYMVVSVTPCRGACYCRFTFVHVIYDFLEE